ncbi:MAG: YggT family protein [Gammaproteobacteria bacterium]
MIANFYNAALYLINTLFLLYLWLLILRVLLQLVRADPYNPISQVIGHLTRYPIAYLQHVVPRYQRLDLAACLWAVLVAWLYLLSLSAFLDRPVDSLTALLYGLRELLIQVFNVYTGSLFVYVLLSWIGPGMNNPAGSILWSLNEPLLRPVRRVLPPYSGLDFSPLVVIVLLQLGRILLFSA